MRVRDLGSISSYLLGTVVVVGISLAATPSTQPGTADDKLGMNNEFGWVWESEPRAANAPSTLGNGIIMRLDGAKDQQMILYVTPANGDPAIAEHRPVAFASGKRVDLIPRGSLGTESLTISLYVLGQSEAAQGDVAIGIEKLTKASLRDVVAPAAVKALREAGALSLPYPELNRPYEFELTTLEGKRISSKDLHGKVVLLDFWATWCSPCMAKMAHLKEIYAKLHGAGFEVIGISHDKSPADARRGVASQQLPWPQVLAPADEDQRRLWHIAVGGSTIPKLLLIDRQGILRGNVTPGALEGAIERLVNGPAGELPGKVQRSAATSGVAPSTGPAAVSSAGPSLLGSWRVLEVSRNGQPMPMPPGGAMAMTFLEGGKSRISTSGGPGGDQEEQSTYVLQGAEISITDSHDKTNTGKVTFEGKDRVILDVAGVGRFTMQRP